MRRKHHACIRTLRTTWWHQAHKPLDLAVLNLLKRAEPEQMVRAKRGFDRQKLLAVVIIWARWRTRNVNDAGVGQEVAARPAPLFALLLQAPQFG